MSNFAIVSDSACDLTAEFRERFKIDDYVPGILVYPDGHSEPADLDWKTITPKEFFAIMKEKKAFFSTSINGIEVYKEAYEKYLKEGKDVLVINLSSGLSGTYDASCMAANELKEKYPDRKVICVDSLRYSTALSLLCVYASKLREEGKSIEETAQWLNDNKRRIHQIGTLEDLFYCKKMGRVSNAAAVMGTLVGIKPMADINNKGVSNVIGKVKGKKAVYSTCVEYMKKTIRNPEKQIVFVAHSDRYNEAVALKEAIEKEIKPKEVIISMVGQSCGPNVGPGLYAAFYFGDEISEGMVEEKKIFAEITKA